MQGQHAAQQYTAGRTASRTRAVFVAAALLLLLCCQLPEATAKTRQGLSSTKTALNAMLQQVAEKTAPDRDVFELLTDNQRLAWGFDAGKTINQTLHALNNVGIELRVDVKMVGFDADGNGKLQVSERDLSRYLKGLRLDLGTAVLQPEVKKMVIKPQVVFNVIKAPRNLHNRVFGALHNAAAIEQARKTDSKDMEAPLYLPYHKVDDIIHTDSRDDHAAFTIYILNPPTLSADYHYTYGAKDDQHHRGCPGSLYVSEQKYAWVDLTAGPVEYGPGAGRSGQVFPHTLPHAMLYKQAAASQAILPDMAALVMSAAQHLVWPPLQHAKMRAYENVEIAVLHMHDTLGPPAQHFKAETLITQLSASLVGVSHVTVKEAWLSFAECDLCVAAYTGALKMRTETAHHTTVWRSHESKFLDRRQLQASLSVFHDAIFSLADLHTQDPTDSKHQVLPVFIFDLSTSDPLLLDGELKAAAFENMVVAVTTKAMDVQTHYMCDFMSVDLQQKDVTREVLGAVLQAGFGVVDPSLYYHPATGVNMNYLWSVGHSPFGPLAQSHTALPAHISGAVKRNLALTAFNGSVSRVVRLMQGLNEATHGGRINQLVRHESKGLSPLAIVNQRLNVFQFKMAMAAAYISHLEFAKALSITRNMAHEIRALERLALGRMGDDLVTDLDCSGSITLWDLGWAPISALGVWLVAVAIRWRLTALAYKLEKLY